MIKQTNCLIILYERLSQKKKSLKDIINILNLKSHKGNYLKLLLFGRYALSKSQNIQ